MRFGFKSSRSLWALPALLALVCAASCDRPAAQAGPARARAAPVHVDTVAAVERDVPNTVLLAGSLKGNQESDLAANATGRVQRTLVERRRVVDRGQAEAEVSEAA